MNNWTHCKRLLCVRLDNLGDLLMTVPAIRALRESVVGRHITILTSGSAGCAVECIPEIDDCLVYNAPWMKSTGLKVDRRDDFQLIETLKAAQFDGAVIFTVFSQSPLPAAMLCYLAEIPLCLAYCHENSYQLLSDWIKDPDPQEGIRHEVQRQLDLVSAIGSCTNDVHLSLSIPATVKIQVMRKLKDRGIHSFDNLVVVHPGATAASRRYPAERFAQVVGYLIHNNCTVVLTGQSQERPLIQEIRARCGEDFYNFAGELDFAELAALIGLARVVISNNTAPAHIAAAMGTPVVDLYALTNPQHSPWQVPHRLLFHDVPCKFCFKSVCPYGHHQCLELVDWQEVAQAVHELWDAKQESAHVHFRDQRGLP